MQDGGDLMDIFKAANAVEGGDAGGAGQAGNPAGDDSGIEFKENITGDDDGGDGGDGNNVGDGSGGAGDDDGGNGDDGDDGGDGDGSGSGSSDIEIPEIVSGLFSAVAESLGIEDAEIPKTPEELVDKLSGMIREGSKPKYSSPLSEELDTVLANGGSIDDFILKYSSEIEFLPSVETEEDKISVIATVLADAGFSKDKIEKKIEKYLENDTLDEEAKDALGVLAEKRNALVKERAEQTKIARETREREVKEFFKSVESEISKLTEVRGIKLTPAQIKELKDYCLVVDKKDGLTGFQRDYAKSPVTNFIESAFFTKYAQKALSAARSAGTSSALDKFKSSLQQNKMAGRGGIPGNPKKGDSVDQFVKLASALSGRK